MRKSSQVKTALVAVGSSIAAAPASALELGEVEVHSTLGQPLRASIAYALGPNETISDTCVSLQRVVGQRGLPAINRGSISVRNGAINITSPGTVSEPMSSLRISVRCSYTPHLVRDFLVFVDPAELPTPAIAAPTPERVAAQPQLAAPRAARSPAAAAPRTAPQTPIADASRYFVQPGDTLSKIAARIEQRPADLRAVVNAIVDANPQHFTDGNPDNLAAATWLTIPSFGADAFSAAPAQPTAAAAAAEPVTRESADSVYEPTVTSQYEVPVESQEVPTKLQTSAPVYEPAAAPQFDTPVEEAAPLAEPESTVEEPATLAELQPGDVVVAGDDRLADAVTIPDTQLEGPTTISTSPNVPIAIIRKPAATETSTGPNWLVWLGAAGGAVGLVLLLFGGRLRERFGSRPIAPSEPPPPREPQVEPEAVAANDDSDFIDIDDDSPTAENLALDADLIVGTGLQEGTDVHVASDFAFASTTRLDIELPEDTGAAAEQPETDIIPPINIDESSILESEILPDDEVDDEDDYDMSVIVDATKMPNPEDVTERDLEAVEVNVDDDTENLIAGDYTVSQEVDYKILEQDYEDELTATQALNAEIQKAAEDSALNLNVDADIDTAQVALATINALDKTGQENLDDDISDDDDTSLNPTVNLEAGDVTVEMVNDDTVQMIDEKTVEMTDDKTVEMPKKGNEAG